MYQYPKQILTIAQHIRGGEKIIHGRYKNIPIWRSYQIGIFFFGIEDKTPAYMVKSRNIEKM